jgi:transcriptional regulator with XRE-family HTH domain
MNLKEARTIEGLTQQELADHLGCTAAHICGIERGKHNVSLAMGIKLMQVLPGLKLETLMKESPQKTR